MKASDIAEKLGARVDDVVRFLLPNGKRSGHEWEVGSLSGEAGKSCRVHLVGEKAGVWSDFNTGEAGDLVGLWMRVRGLSLFEACKEAMDHLGIVEQRIENPRPTYKAPSRDGISKLNPDHAAWLRDVRMLPDESVKAFKVVSKQTANGLALMFPYLRGGELVAAKYRGIPDKKFWTDAECEPCLFGWQAMPPDARSATICEGELDAIAWHAYGVPALSVPFGGGGKKKQQWVESEFDRLALFDTLYLSMDMDSAGDEAVAELVKRFGAERCRIVRLPFKDANECLQKDVSREDMIAAIRSAKTLDPSELKRASDFENEIVKQFQETEDFGICLPWKKTWETIRLRPGEVSIWAGVNGHGKSEVIGHITAYACSKGFRACVASMEFRPARWLKRMVRQICGFKTPTEGFIRHVARWSHDRLWVFEAVGNTKAGKVLEVFAYAAKRYKIDLFVIDNLAKCGFGEDDYNGQKGFIDALTDLAREHDVHVALLHHMRKGESEEKPNGKMGVKGTGAITDMVDTVLEVWRNKKKERLVGVCRRDGIEPSAELLEEPDGLVLCHKQRNGEAEPNIALWFDTDTHQYLSRPTHRSQPMVDYSETPENRWAHEQFR